MSEQEGHDWDRWTDADDAERRAYTERLIGPPPAEGGGAGRTATRVRARPPRGALGAEALGMGVVVALLGVLTSDPLPATCVLVGVAVRRLRGR